MQRFQVTELCAQGTIEFQTNDQILRKNFQVLIGSMQTIERRFCMLQQKVFSILETTNTKIENAKTHMQQQFNVIKHRDEEVKEKLAEIQRNDVTISYNLAEQESKILDLFNFKKLQIRQCEQDRLKIDLLKSSTNSLTKSMEVTKSQLERKCGRNDLDKIYSELNQNESVSRKLSKAIQEISQDMGKGFQLTSNRILGAEQISALIDLKIQATLKFDRPMSRRTSFQLSTKLLGLGADGELSKDDEIVQLQIKVNRLIEAQKNRQKTSKNLQANKKVDFGDMLSQQIKTLQQKIVFARRKIDAIQHRLVATDNRVEDNRIAAEGIIGEAKKYTSQQLKVTTKQILMELAKQGQTLSLTLDKKLSIEDYVSHNMSHDRHLKKLDLDIQTKPGKADVKKALMFFEGKLKELILMVSQHATDNKGLAMKLKCLSCDKEIEGEMLSKPPTTRRTASRALLLSTQHRRKDQFQKIISQN